MKELQIFRGHKKEICCNIYIYIYIYIYATHTDTLLCLAAKWHPQHERLLATGGSDGSLMFWIVGQDQPAGEQETAHESNVWSLDWHPVGHILVSGSNDHTTRFWTRPRPGELSTGKFDSSQQFEEEQAPSKPEHDQRQQYTELPPFRPNIMPSQNKLEPPPFRPAGARRKYWPEAPVKNY